jgi:acyl-CoA thioesterase-1
MWHLADGSLFFVGSVMILLAVLFSSLTRLRIRNLLAYPLVIMGASAVLLSATPLPVWFYTLWGAAVIAWLAGGVGHRTASRKLRFVSRVVLAVLCLVALALELPYHLMPDVPYGEGNVLYVIGDSFSAGIGGVGEQAWPQVLGKAHDVRVFNLAKAGATVADASRQAKAVHERHAVVLVEIGGNDLFPPTPTQEFRAALERLLSDVTGPARTVVMLELPLLPFQNEYGRIQRELAKQYHVFLVPKRFLVAVLSSSGATVDLAHLSPAGHNLMAERTWPVIRAALAPPASPTGALPRDPANRPTSTPRAAD